jgi:hypothetical protein
MRDTQEQMMLAPGLPQAVKDWNTVTGLPRAVDEWRIARRECQLTRSNETIRRYCGATDELARALLSDFVSEPGSHEVFERFHAWLVDEEERSQ